MWPGPVNAQLRGDVAERAVPLVVVEPAGSVHVRDEQVEPAVAVVVAPGRSLGDAFIDDAGRGGDVLERAVALVVIEPAAGRWAWGRSRWYSPQTNRSSRPSLS